MPNAIDAVYAAQGRRLIELARDAQDPANAANLWERAANKMAAAHQPEMAATCRRTAASYKADLCHAAAAATWRAAAYVATLAEAEAARATADRWRALADQFDEEAGA